MTKQLQTVKPELTNSEVALIRKGLEMLDAASLGFEEQVKVILAKLKTGQPDKFKVAKKAFGDKGE